MNDEVAKYQLLARFEDRTDERALRSRMRLRTDEEQVHDEGSACVGDAVGVAKNPIYAMEKFEAIGINRRRAVRCLVLTLAFSLLILFGWPAEGSLAYEIVVGLAVLFAVCAGVFAWVARAYLHDPGMPSVLTPQRVDDLVRWLRLLGELGRPQLGIWSRTAAFLIVSAEMGIVLLLSRELLLANMKPLHAYLICGVFALASGLVMIELVHFLALALRRGSVRDLHCKLAESAEHQDRQRAEAIQQANNSGVGGHWYLGSRLVGHKLRCYREALAWGTTLTAIFIGTVCLRVAIALGSGDLGELVALGISAVMTAGTLIISTKRFADAADLSDEVGAARRVVAEFPNGDHLVAHVERITTEVCARLRDAQLVMKNAWTPRKLSQKPLEMDLVGQFNRELEAHTITVQPVTQLLTRTGEPSSARTWLPGERPQERPGMS